MSDVAMTLTVNGRHRTFSVPPNTVLADLLRDSCHLKGCKVGCDQAACGACTVLVDGQPTTACSTFAFAVDGRAVTTVEGLAAGGTLGAVQEAFLDAQAFQCGFCTAGMIVTTTALLANHPQPSRAEITDWLGGNLCRCTGYRAIVDAVEQAAARLA